MELVRHAIPELHLALDTFTVDGISFTPWDGGGGVVGHGVRIGDHDTLRWLIRATDDGKGESYLAEPTERIATFLEDHRDWVPHTEKRTVCGATVDVYVVEHAEEHITCVMTPTGNHPAWIPPRRAIAFALPGRSAIASFEIEAAEIAAFQPTIDRIIASLDCNAN